MWKREPHELNPPVKLSTLAPGCRLPRWNLSISCCRPKDVLPPSVHKFPEQMLWAYHPGIWCFFSLGPTSSTSGRFGAVPCWNLPATTFGVTLAMGWRDETAESAGFQRNGLGEPEAMGRPPDGHKIPAACLLHSVSLYSSLRIKTLFAATRGVGVVMFHASGNGPAMATTERCLSKGFLQE